MKWHHVGAEFLNSNFSLSEVGKSKLRQHGDIKILITSLFTDEISLIFPQRYAVPTLSNQQLIHLLPICIS